MSSIEDFLQLIEEIVLVRKGQNCFGSTRESPGKMIQRELLYMWKTRSQES